MPNRYIRESAIESEAVNSVSWQAEVFYRRLLNRVDDFGRYSANSAILRAAVFPLQLDQVRETDIPRLLAECEEAGLLYVYAAGVKPVLVVNKWEKGRAKTSKYPPPPDDIRQRMQTYVHNGQHPQTYVAPSDSDSDSDSDSPHSPPRGGGESSTQVSEPPKPIRFRRAQRVDTLKSERQRIEDDMREILRPGGCAYPVEPTGDKAQRLELLKQAHAEIDTLIKKRLAEENEKPATEVKS